MRHRDRCPDRRGAVITNEGKPAKRTGLDGQFWRAWKRAVLAQSYRILLCSIVAEM